jgi:aldehyde dehydrogenase (NAD+)
MPRSCWTTPFLNSSSRDLQGISGAPSAPRHALHRSRPSDIRIAREEVFGPVVSLIGFGTFAQAFAIADDIDHALSTVLCAKNVNLAFVAMRDLKAGVPSINAPTIGAEVHLPF